MGLGGGYEQSTDDSKYQALLEQTFSFGSQQISGKHVFLARRYVYAMVTPFPVTIGHVIVCPTRTVEKISELHELEVLELFVTA